MWKMIQFDLQSQKKIDSDSTQNPLTPCVVLSKNTGTCFETMFMLIHLSLLQNMMKQGLVLIIFTEKKNTI